MRLHSLFYALLGLKNIKVLEDIVNKKGSCLLCDYLDNLL